MGFIISENGNHWLFCEFNEEVKRLEERPSVIHEILMKDKAFVFTFAIIGS
jgi:hypothetical protein